MGYNYMGLRRADKREWAIGLTAFTVVAGFCMAIPELYWHSVISSAWQWFGAFFAGAALFFPLCFFLKADRWPKFSPTAAHPAGWIIDWGIVLAPTIGISVVAGIYGNVSAAVIPLVPYMLVFLAAIGGWYWRDILKKNLTKQRGRNTAAGLLLVSCSVMSPISTILLPTGPTMNVVSGLLAGVAFLGLMYLFFGWHFDRTPLDGSGLKAWRTCNCNRL